MTIVLRMWFFKNFNCFLVYLMKSLFFHIPVFLIYDQVIELGICSALNKSILAWAIVISFELFHCFIFSDCHGYQCFVCFRSYQKYSSLWRHRRFECSQPKRFQCPYCKRSFRQRYDIKKHVRNLHPEISEEFSKKFSYLDLFRRDTES